MDGGEEGLEEDGGEEAQVEGEEGGRAPMEILLGYLVLFLGATWGCAFLSFLSSRFPFVPLYNRFQTHTHTVNHSRDASLSVCNTKVCNRYSC